MLYSKANLLSYLKYIQNKLTKQLHFDEFLFYKKAEIVTKKQLELVDKGWDSDDIAKASYIHTGNWLKLAKK